MVLAGLVHRMAVFFLVLEVEDLEPDGLGIRILVRILHCGSGICAPGRGEVQELGFQQGAVGPVEFGYRPGLLLACHDDHAYAFFRVLEIVVYVIFGVLVPAYVHPFLEFHGLAGDVGDFHRHDVGRPPPSVVGGIDGEGEGEAVFIRHDLAGSPHLAAMVRFPGDVGPCEGMSRIGLYAALDLHAVERHLEPGELVEDQVEGREHEVVHQDALHPDAPACLFYHYIVAAVPLAPAQDEGSRHAAVGIGYKCLLFQRFPFGILEDSLHLDAFSGCPQGIFAAI